MKAIVVYNSNTGFTEKYAKWIGEELNIEVVNIKNIKLKTLKEFDLVIYGGWIFANKITKYKKIKKLKINNLYVFGVGVNPKNDNTIETIKTSNMLDEVFYFQGGICNEKLKGIKKLLIKMIKKSLEKKENKTSEDLEAIEVFNGKDVSDKMQINELIETVKTKL